MSQELFASVENSLKVLCKEVIAIPELKDYTVPKDVDTQKEGKG